MPVSSSWRLLIVYYIAISGLWGFFLKIISRHLDWKTTMFYVWIGVSAVYLVFITKKVDFSWSKFHLFAIFTGMLAAMSAMAFYKALSLMPGSLVIPLSSLYVVITVILCLVFLREAVSLRIVSGIILSIISIILLMK